MFDPVYRGSEVIEVLRILFKKSLQPYGSRLSYETYRSSFLYKRVFLQKIFFLKYKNYGGNIFFKKSDLKKIKSKNSEIRQAYSKIIKIEKKRWVKNTVYHHHLFAFFFGRENLYFFKILYICI